MEGRPHRAKDDGNSVKESIVFSRVHPSDYLLKSLNLQTSPYHTWPRWLILVPLGGTDSLGRRGAGEVCVMVEKVEFWLCASQLEGLHSSFTGLSRDEVSHPHGVLVRSGA